MKVTKQMVTGFILLVVIASLYRIMPGRPYGFAPQIAMAIFGGAIIKDKKFAFLLPLLSMFVSDALYEILFRNGVGNMPGFYEGQITNYILFASLTLFGFFIKNFNIGRIALAAIAAPTTYFLISNFLIWLSNSPLAGLGRPKTFNGLLLCFSDGLPFYPWSIAATFIFSAILFGSYYLITKQSLRLAQEHIKR
ncbi:MAG TPA: DUF6580 family putative transport protein [Chitinophagaceae bacterium]|nr:DUF6580 family putative transport protein [Chitinophagaceae bacterium]